MRAFLLVAMGGAFGAMARYGTSVLVARLWCDRFPLATWVVNLAGCFLIGVLTSMLLRGQATDAVRYVGIVGFLGAYTTFSAFSFETVALLQQGQIGLAVLNAGGSVVLGVLLVWAGMWVATAVPA